MNHAAPLFDWHAGQAVTLCSMVSGAVERIPAVIDEVCALGVLVKAGAAWTWLDDDGASPDGLMWIEVKK